MDRHKTKKNKQLSCSWPSWCVCLASLPPHHVAQSLEWALCVFLKWYMAEVPTMYVNGMGQEVPGQTRTVRFEVTCASTQQARDAARKPPGWPRLRAEFGTQAEAEAEAESRPESCPRCSSWPPWASWASWARRVALSYDGAGLSCAVCTSAPQSGPQRGRQ
jgi:hypothetical protein